jgi:5-methylcytosine-specific restriction endonuclease McrA
MSRRQSHLRAKLLLADPTCAYCGEPLTPGICNSSGVLDHVVPRSAGGPDGSRNRVLCCRTCDRRKGDMEPAALLAWARRVAEVAERMASAAEVTRADSLD